jgi:hypothetical protein
MTPKEKAEELFTTYRFALSIKNAPLGNQKDLIAKQCALIAVDEILLSFTALSYGVIYLGQIDYWQEVKQEIEKL